MFLNFHCCFVHIFKSVSLKMLHRYQLHYCQHFGRTYYVQFRANNGDSGTSERLVPIARPHDVTVRRDHHGFLHRRGNLKLCMEETLLQLTHRTKDHVRLFWFHRTRNFIVVLITQSIELRDLLKLLSILHFHRLNVFCAPQ